MFWQASQLHRHDLGCHGSDPTSDLALQTILVILTMTTTLTDHRNRDIAHLRPAILRWLRRDCRRRLLAGSHCCGSGQCVALIWSSPWTFNMGAVIALPRSAGQSTTLLLTLVCCCSACFPLFASPLPSSKNHPMMKMQMRHS